MILLDTNALIFLLGDSRRTRRLIRQQQRIYLSPICLLELKFLEEAGRGRFLADDPVDAVARDPRWTLDDPSVAHLVSAAMKIDWTRDLFDRLIVAHCLYRGWRLATSDRLILSHLPERSRFAL